MEHTEILDYQPERKEYHSKVARFFNFVSNNISLSEKTRTYKSKETNARIKDNIEACEQAAKAFNELSAWERFKMTIKDGIDDLLFEFELEEEPRQKKIEQMILAAYSNARSTSLEDLEKFLKTDLAKAPDLFHQHGKIEAKHVMAQIEELSEEKKGELEQARLEWQSRKSAPTLEA